MAKDKNTTGGRGKKRPGSKSTKTKKGTTETAKNNEG